MLGILDDLIIVPLLIKLTISLIPDNIVAEAVEFVKNEPTEKWKRNWLIVALIIFIWLALAYFLVPLAIEFLRET